VSRKKHEDSNDRIKGEIDVIKKMFEENPALEKY